MTMEMELSHTKNEYTFLTTKTFVKILCVNTMILLLLDILDDTKPKNSLPETTGGHISKVPFGNISTNVFRTMPKNKKPLRKAAQPTSPTCYSLKTLGTQSGR